MENTRTTRVATAQLITAAKVNSKFRTMLQGVKELIENNEMGLNSNAETANQLWDTVNRFMNDDEF